MLGKQLTTFLSMALHIQSATCLPIGIQHFRREGDLLVTQIDQGSIEHMSRRVQVSTHSPTQDEATPRIFPRFLSSSEHGRLRLRLCNDAEELVQGERYPWLSIQSIRMSTHHRHSLSQLQPLDSTHHPGHSRGRPRIP